MKLAIIAAAILASSSAMAVQSESAILTFTNENFSFCELSVVTPEAPVIFSYAESTDDSNYAEAKVMTGNSKAVTVTGVGSWTENAAWGGSDPMTTIHAMVEGHVSKPGAYAYKNVTSFGDIYPLKLDANQEVNFLMAVEASPMTHTGKARMEATIQFECE